MVCCFITCVLSLEFNQSVHDSTLFTMHSSAGFLLLLLLLYVHDFIITDNGSTEFMFVVMMMMVMILQAFIILRIFCINISK